jgi:hypothetical protein
VKAELTEAAKISPFTLLREIKKDRKQKIHKILCKEIMMSEFFHFHCSFEYSSLLHLPKKKKEVRKRR